MKLYVFNEHRLGVAGIDGTVVDITDLVPSQTDAKERMNALIRHWGALRDEVDGVDRRSGRRQIDDFLTVEDTESAVVLEGEIDQAHPEDAT